MFEKEAEEYADERISKVLKNATFKSTFWHEQDWENCKQDFLAGAEFGYNKAKEEIQGLGLALQSDMDKTIEQNLQLKKELNKANEWHCVKDELPKETKNYCIYSEEWGVEIRKFFVDVGYFECRKNDDIIAWKEIVLPKESEQK